MRGRVRTALLSVGALGGLVVWGCSSSNPGTSTGGGGGSSDAGGVTYVASGTCDGKNVKCIPDLCTCNDGTGRQTTNNCSGGQCVDQTSECTQLCGAAGVADAGPLDTVIGSAECNTFCAKATSQCPSASCEELFFCVVPSGECEASLRAFLQCEVDTGTWACAQNGNGWSVGSTCSRHTELCGGDGG